MIDWNTVDINKELSLQIIEDDKSYHIKAVLVEYEWALNRKPEIADIKVLHSDDSKLNKGDVIRLPIITNNEEEESYLVFAPTLLHPAKEIKLKAKIILN
jgi:hypothetical protein